MDVGAGGIGGETGTTMAAVGETLSPGGIPGTAAVLALRTSGR